MGYGLHLFYDDYTVMGDTQMVIAEYKQKGNNFIFALTMKHITIFGATAAIAFGIISLLSRVSSPVHFCLSGKTNILCASLGSDPADKERMLDISGNSAYKLYHFVQIKDASDVDWWSSPSSRQGTPVYGQAQLNSGLIEGKDKEIFNPGQHDSADPQEMGQHDSADPQEMVNNQTQQQLGMAWMQTGMQHVPDPGFKQDLSKPTLKQQAWLTDDPQQTTLEEAPPQTDYSDGKESEFDMQGASNIQFSSMGIELEPLQPDPSPQSHSELGLDQITEHLDQTSVSITQQRIDNQTNIDDHVANQEQNHQGTEVPPAAEQLKLPESQQTPQFQDDPKQPQPSPNQYKLATQGEQIPQPQEQPQQQQQQQPQQPQRQQPYQQQSYQQQSYQQQQYQQQQKTQQQQSWLSLETKKIYQQQRQQLQQSQLKQPQQPHQQQAEPTQQESIKWSPESESLHSTQGQADEAEQTALNPPGTGMETSSIQESPQQDTAPSMEVLPQVQAQPSSQHDEVHETEPATRE